METKLKKRVVALAFIATTFALLTTCAQGSQKKTQSKSNFTNEYVSYIAAVQKEVVHFSRVIELTNPPMEGQDVLELQNHLLSLGFNELGSENGYYGHLTEGVIKSIQPFFSFEPNGKIDKTLWDYIFDNENDIFLQNISNVITASAQNESDFETDGKGTITAYKNNSSVLVIPSQIGGMPVTAISDFVFDGLSGVIIPNGVTSIGKSAFAENNLKYVTIPNSVTFISKYAFSDNHYLKRITIGANVTVERTKLESYQYIWGDVYPDFTALYNANGKQAGTYLWEGNYWSLNGKTIRAYDKSENGFTIDAEGTIIAYDGRQTSLVIPDKIGGVTVTAIEEDVFKEKKLTAVTIPTNVTDIGLCAFRDNQLTSITIGENVNLMAFLIGDPPTLDPCRSFDNCFDYNCYKGKAGTYKNSNNIWSLNGETIAAYAQTGIGFFVTDGKGTIINFIPEYKQGDEGVFAIPAEIGGMPVTAIGSSILSGGGINGAIIIPESVTCIHSGAFSNDYVINNNIIISTITIGANVALEGGFPDDSFEKFYNINGKKAGTYEYKNEKWHMK